MEELFRFFEGLERKGPGGEAETLAALDLARAAAPERLGAGRAPNILDIGCGAGLHTRLLARETGGRVLATDIHRPYLDELVAAAQREGVADRITPLVCDMNVLADAPEVRARAPFDCIWAEGSVFVVGLERALGMLPGLLAPGGIFACTDAAWRRDPDDPAHPAPAEVRAYAAEVFPDMPTEEGGLAMARRHGWEPVGHFLLDARCWRDYYRGYTERLPGFLAEAEARAAETGDPAPLQAARTLAGELTHEMAMFETYSDWYTYLFLILRRA